MIGDPKNLMKPPYRVHFFKFEKFDTGSVINDPENTLTLLFQVNYIENCNSNLKQSPYWVRHFDYRNSEFIFVMRKPVNPLIPFSK